MEKFISKSDVNTIGLHSYVNIFLINKVNINPKFNILKIKLM